MTILPLAEISVRDPSAGMSAAILQDFSIFYGHVELRMQILAGIDDRAALDQQIAALRKGRAHILGGGAAEAAALLRNGAASSGDPASSFENCRRVSMRLPFKFVNDFSKCDLSRRGAGPTVTALTVADVSAAYFFS